jgi:hypothetical protein
VRPETQQLATDLEALSAFLRAHGESRWSNWTTRCRVAIQRGDLRGVDRLLTAYDGLGFGDLFLSPENGHRTPASEVPAANEQLSRLRARALELARTIRRPRP